MEAHLFDFKEKPAYCWRMGTNSIVHVYDLMDVPSLFVVIKLDEQAKLHQIEIDFNAQITPFCTDWSWLSNFQPILKSLMGIKCPILFWPKVATLPFEIARFLLHEGDDALYKTNFNPYKTILMLNHRMNIIQEMVEHDNEKQEWFTELIMISNSIYKSWFEEIAALLIDGVDINQLFQLALTVHRLLPVRWFMINHVKKLSEESRQLYCQKITSQPEFKKVLWGRSLLRSLL